MQDGDFSPTTSPPFDWSRCWKLDMHARLKFFFWKVAWDALPTRTKLADKLQANFQGPLLCPLCGSSNESLPHLLFFCSFTRFIWRSAPWPLSVDIVSSDNIHCWLHIILDTLRLPGISATESHHFQLFVVITMYSIWQARNQLIYDNSCPHPYQLLREILKTSWKHLQA